MSTPSSATDSPGQSVQSEKSKKYDRQLRLWGDHGQRSIEQAHVCLINANCAGTEFIKSLVLPGIGAFTVVDGGTVTEEDIGDNFFFDSDSLGKKRAQVAKSLLLELNPDVRGDYIDESIDELLDKNSQLFSSFTLVLASNLLNENSLVRLSKTLWDFNVPLIVLRTNGLIGSIRLQVQEHPVIEAHPDTALEDLRLDDPFDELREYLDSFDLESMSKKDLAHSPYLILIYHYLNKWRQASGLTFNQLPANYKEKQQVKKLIVEGAQHFKEKFKTVDNEQEKEIELENFEEAIKAVNSILVNSKAIPSNLTELNKLSKTAPATKFWLLFKALNLFIERTGTLPVRGSLPDMTADSLRYINLQRIYAAKAKQDADMLAEIIQTLVEQSQAPAEFSESEIRLFCRNVHCLTMIRTSPLFAEYGSERSRIHDLLATESIDSDQESHLAWYLMMRAVERFYTRFSRVPGELNQSCDGDINLLKEALKEVMSKLGMSTNSFAAKDDYVQEIVRFGCAQIHSVSAFVAGCAAHEAIKIITGQYIPVNNTFLYNAITSTTATYEM